MEILLLDEGQHQSLYLCRKLQECTDLDPDIHIAIASSNPRQQKMARLFPVTLYPTPAATASDYRDCIARIAHNFDFIIPISNNCLPVAYDPATSWSNKVFPQLSAKKFALLFDKFASTQLAESLGIQCPATIKVDTVNDLDRALDELGLPIVLKQCTGWAGNGVRICHSREELASQFEVLRQQPGSQFFCQQYIKGIASLAGGLFIDGEAIRIYCANHTFSYPPITGSSKSLVSCVDKPMQDALLTFCRAIRWTGLGNLDFIRNENGELYFLEMNPRIWGSIAASEDADSNMIKPLVELLLNRKPAAMLTYENNINTALFPQYLITLCKQGGYRNLWRVISEKSLWQGAPWNNYRYLAGYMIKIGHAWIHGLKRTLRNSLGLDNDSETAS